MENILIHFLVFIIVVQYLSDRLARLFRIILLSSLPLDIICECIII